MAAPRYLGTSQSYARANAGIQNKLGSYNAWYKAAAQYVRQLL